MPKRGNKHWKIYYTPRIFREDTAPKQLTNHNARNHESAGTECLELGLCMRQDLTYRHWIHVHYRPISVHLKCWASEDDCTEAYLGHAEKDLICVNIWKCRFVTGFTGKMFLIQWARWYICTKGCQVMIGLGNGLASIQCQATIWTNAELLPMGPREKSSETIGLTLEAETKWPQFSKRRFQLHLFKFWLIYHWISFFMVQLTISQHWFR